MSPEFLERLTDWLTYWFPVPEKSVRVEFVIGPVAEQSISFSKGTSMANLVLTDTQKCTLTIAPVDGKGNAAKVDGVPVWASSDATILTVTPAADGMSAVVLAVGVLGSAQVNVSADADLGTGVKTITGTLDVTVQGGAAVSLGIGTGTPEEQ